MVYPVTRAGQVARQSFGTLRDDPDRDKQNALLAGSRLSRANGVAKRQARGNLHARSDRLRPDGPADASFVLASLNGLQPCRRALPPIAVNTKNTDQRRKTTLRPRRSLVLETQSRSTRQKRGPPGIRPIRPPTLSFWDPACRRQPRPAVAGGDRPKKVRRIPLQIHTDTPRSAPALTGGAGMADGQRVEESYGHYEKRLICGQGIGELSIRK